MKIIVLAGGISTEREVSIVTGTDVCEALQKNGHDAALLDVYFGTDYQEDVFSDHYDLAKAVAEIKTYSTTVEETKKNRKEFFGRHVIELCQRADLVFMALHGENGENGKVQAAFDLYGIRYTGTGYLGSAMAMDKGITKKMLLASGIPTPQGVTLKKKNRVVFDFEKAGLSYPCIVKPCCGGSSIGVTIVFRADQMEQALDEAFALEEEVVIEEYVKGREFSVGVVDGEPYPIIEIRPKEGFYDYKNKYEPGKTEDLCPAPLSEELTKKMQNYAVQASRVLTLNKYSRIDFLMNEQEQMYCLEANTLPGMTPTSLLPQEAAVLGIDYGQLCEKLIAVSMKE